MGYIAATTTYNGRVKPAEPNSLVPEKKKFPEWLPWLVLGGLTLGGGAAAVNSYNNYVKSITRHYRNRNIAASLLALLGVGGVAAAIGGVGKTPPNRDSLSDMPPELESAAQTGS